MRTSTHIGKYKLSVAMWLLGMPGVVAVSIVSLPMLFAGKNLPMPMSEIIALQIMQSAVLLAAAAWLGSVLGARVDLHAPSITALLEGRQAWTSLKRQIMSGVPSGVIGGLLSVWLVAYAPQELKALPVDFELPLWLRALYGGMTEELLLRWGLMSLLLWLMWRFFQDRKDAPQPIYVLLAVLISSLIFGAGHLPAAAAMSGGLTPGVIIYVLAVNASFGILSGYLFWRSGLEAAMIAHAIAHVIMYIVR